MSNKNQTEYDQTATNFLDKLLLADRKVPKLFKYFANNSSANIELSKTKISKIIQSGAFLGRLLEPLMKV